jgi:hypothetical protein
LAVSFNDNYVDVLSASAYDNKIAWYKNMDGNGDFSSRETISSSQTGARDVCAADLDNDNDMDVISIGEYKIVWYENLTNITSVQNNQTDIPDNFELYQNYPNPFNPSTNIRFTLPKTEHISLKIYNIIGQEVAELINDIRSAGEHQILWQTDGLSSGVYFAYLKKGKQFKTKKLVLQR